MLQPGHTSLSYLQEDNFDSAYAVMDRLPVEFKLKAKEVNEKDRTKQYIGLVQGWRMAGRTDAELKESEVAALEAFAEGQYDRPAEWAQNLLCFGYGRCRAPLTGGFDRPQPRMVAVATADAPTSAGLSIHPNPANSWVAFNYNLQALPDHAELIVRDAAGREVYRAALQASEQQQLWDTREVASGTYNAVLVNSGHLLCTEKLIVKP